MAELSESGSVLSLLTGRPLHMYVCARMWRPEASRSVVPWGLFTLVLEAGPLTGT